MRRHLTTAAFSLAGLSWTLGQGVLPDMGAETGSRYDAVAAASTLESLSAGLLVLAGVFLVLGSMVAVHRLAAWAGTTGRRLMLAGTALTGLGGLWLVGGRAAFNLMFVRVVDTESLPRETAIALLDSSGGPGFAPLVLMLPGLLLAPGLLTVGLKRAGLAGWMPLPAWLLGIATFLGTESRSKPPRPQASPSPASHSSWPPEPSTPCPSRHRRTPARPTPPSTPTARSHGPKRTYDGVPTPPSIRRCAAVGLDCTLSATWSLLVACGE